MAFLSLTLLGRGASLDSDRDPSGGEGTPMKSMGSDGEDEGGGPLMLTAVGAYATTLAYMLTTRLGKASKQDDSGPIVSPAVPESLGRPDASQRRLNRLARVHHDPHRPRSTRPTSPRPSSRPATAERSRRPGEHLRARLRSRNSRMSGKEF